MSQTFDPARIAAVLGFTTEELMLNRGGAMSDRQRAMLRGKQRSGSAGLAFVAVFAVVFGLFAAAYVVPKVSDGSTAPIAAIVWGVIGVVLVIVVSSWLRTLRRVGRLTSGKVREVVGAARTHARRLPGNMSDPAMPAYGGGTRYELTIGKLTFFVRNRAVLDAFTEGGSYRGYYTGGGGRLYNVLLSAERIG